MFDKTERISIALITTIILVLTSGFGSVVLAQATESTLLEEITVTAQRREQSRLEIPSALSVITGDAIQQRVIETSHELELSIPGLNFMSVSGTSQVTLRGVGTSYSGPALGNSVALYIDDAYIANQVGAIEIFYDVNRVEVLKGPQPTLYGRNATGGAIQYLTNRPSLDGREAYVEAGYAELDTLEFEGMFNQPLGDNFALRVSGKSWDRGTGHVRNVVNGDKITGENDHKRIRTQLLFQPNEQFRAIGKYEYSHDKGDEPLRRQNATGLLCRYCVGGDDGNSLGWYQTNQTPQDTIDQNVINTWGPNALGGGSLKRNRKIHHATLNMDYEFNDTWKLSSITQYREINATGGQDQDASTADSINAWTKAPGIDYKSFTQELRIATDSDARFNFTAGFVYGEDDNQFSFGVGGSDPADELGGFSYNLFQLSVDNFDDIKSYSVYAEGYFDVIENLTLTVGGRYTDDKVTHRWANSSTAGNGTQTEKFDKFTPRVALNYQNDWGSFYASYSQGFKAGGFNSPAFGMQTRIEPEKIDAFEVGAKLTPWDNVTIDLAVYHYDWDNMQVAVIDTSGGGIAQENAAKAEIDGFEFGIKWAANEMVTLGLAGAFLDGEFTDFTNASIFVPVSTITPGARGLVKVASDVTGHRTTMTPDTSITADMNIAFPISGSWSGNFSVLAAYTSDYDMITAGGGPAQLAVQDDYTIVNLGLMVENESGISLQVYADNLTDEKYLFESQTTTDGGYQGVQFPRVVGFRARKTW